MIVFFAAAMIAAAAPGAAVSCPQDNSGRSLICRALAAQGQGQADAAAQRFEEAAATYAVGDPQRDRAYAAAGNMWIVANQPGKAALALDRALAGSALQGEQRGLALLDRARAAEAQNDLTTARAKVREAEATIGEDAFLWYFSAALAIREGDAPTARQAIARALSLAPTDPTVLFEAGHVAHFAGDLTAARDYWSRASAADTQGKSGAAARQALALLDAPAKVQSAAPAAK